MKCIKCKSEKIKLIGTSYPQSYECLKCGHMFIKATHE